jgi:hypothetical protein
MISVGVSGSKSKSNQQSQTSQLTPAQVRAYFSDVDEISGGRLSRYATEGTAPVDYQGLALAGEAPGGRQTIQTASYQQLTPDELRAVGGAGETRRFAIERARKQAVGDQAADPSLSVAQRFRARQLTDQDAGDQLDAVNRETEALITQLAGGEREKAFTADAARAQAINQITSEELSRRYQAELDKAGLTAADLDQLAQIYYGGKGQQSSSVGRSGSGSFGFNFGIG